jgi:2-polyprenyl-3-methyl-5-hydroxy-6-metoxy-1,4-benzoquinol methylase
MPDAHYELPELAALYDVDSAWSDDRDFYLKLAGPQPIRVLEIGAGTGLVARAMAKAGHDVTAIDPALAMLDVGRRSPFGERIRWLTGTAQDFAVDERFDLVFMTGHAFQVLLEDDDIRQSLTNIHHHLKPGGVLAFESRNPALPWETIFNGVETLQTPNGPVPVEWRVLWRRGEFVRFDTHYQLLDGERISESTLRFLRFDRLKEFLGDAGLEVESLYGDWDKSPFEPENSREIILLARRRD